MPFFNKWAPVKPVIRLKIQSYGRQSWLFQFLSTYIRNESPSEQILYSYKNVVGKRSMCPDLKQCNKWGLISGMSNSAVLGPWCIPNKLHSCYKYSTVATIVLLLNRYSMTTNFSTSSPWKLSVCSVTSWDMISW